MPLIFKEPSIIRFPFIEISPPVIRGLIFLTNKVVVFKEPSIIIFPLILMSLVVSGLIILTYKLELQDKSATFIELVLKVLQHISPLIVIWVALKIRSLEILIMALDPNLRMFVLSVPLTSIS